MNKKLLVASALCVTTLFSVGVSKANAEVDGLTVTEASVLSSQVLTKAEDLNNSILAEINKIVENRELKLEQERQNLSAFISNARQSRFSNYDVRTKTNLTGEQIDLMLKGTEMHGLGEAYAEAEELYGISSIVLVGISALESGWGTSGIAQRKNNIFGFQAYDSNVDAARKFKTKEEGILHVAEYLAKNYVSPDGKYYGGVTLKGLNKRYSTDDNWNNKVTDAMNKASQKLY